MFEPGEPAELSPAERERAWIAEIADGSREAFAELYRAYQQRLCRYFLRLLRDAELAAELADDVLFEVWKGARRFAGRSQPSTWIFGIAHHKAVSELRRRRIPLVDAAKEGDLPDAGPGPAESAMAEDLRSKLAGALRSLSPAHREVVMLTFYEGCSYEEIAQILGCPVNTVKTRMFYAKQRLRPILERMHLGR